MDEQEKKLAIKVGVGVVILVVLYYLISPYQNCTREGQTNSWCTRHSSW